MTQTAGTRVHHRPNVLWIMVDQLRAHALGYAGDPNVRTPNLDRLAAEGVTFTNAVAGAPLCCPARGSMMTGRYAHNSGVAGHRHPMPTDTRTVAHELTDAGYRTCYVGKWHLDGDRPELGPQVYGETEARSRMIPPERRGGFTDWWAYENNNQPFDCRVHTDAGMAPEGVEVTAERDGMQQFTLPDYETDALTDILLRWLRDHERERSPQPFFAVLSVQPPHNPYTAPEADMARHTPGKIQLRPNVPPVPRVQERARRDLAGYYAAIERIDLNVGRIRAALQELGIADNTYLMFFSDHGDMLGSHGRWLKLAPWEESLRIPFIIGGLGADHQVTNRRSNPINHVDLAPTTLGLCGLPVPDWMEGTNYSRCTAVYDAGEGLPDSAYIGIPEAYAPPTDRPYSGPWHGNSVDRPWRGIVTADGWKYVCVENQPWMLTNLDEDPYELMNHAFNPAYYPVRQMLHQRLLQWADASGDSFPFPAA